MVITLDGKLICSNQRLIIKSIAVENFKSYFEKHVIGPFHPSFITIVGPIGSGKSNLIDALLFVFGYKVKKMRQGKFCDLIYLADGNILPFCSVSVEFGRISRNHEISSLSTIEDDVKVERIVYKNNKSEHLLNGNASSWTTITDS